MGKEEESERQEISRGRNCGGDCHAHLRMAYLGPQKPPSHLHLKKECLMRNWLHAFILPLYMLLHLYGANQQYVNTVSVMLQIPDGHKFSL